MTSQQHQPHSTPAAELGSCGKFPVHMLMNVSTNTVTLKDIFVLIQTPAFQGLDVARK